jgi:hypothetical protein
MRYCCAGMPASAMVGIEALMNPATFVQSAREAVIIR